MKIRALVYSHSSFDESSLQERVDKLLKAGNEAEIWSYRVTLPPSRGLSLDRILSLSSNGKVLYSSLHLRSSSPQLPLFKDYLRSGENLFGSVLVSSPEHLRDLSKLVASLDPEEASRFSLLFSNDFLQTPYFPAGSSSIPEHGVSLSLLYVNEFIKGDPSEALRLAGNIGVKVSEMLGVPFMGVDGSLSPWREESVGKLIEFMTSSRMFSQGDLWAVSSLNSRILQSLAEAGVKSLGFNEVMLPVGEDELLIERVEDGSLRLRDLLSLSQVCVAGIDMIGIDLDRIDLYSLLRDVYAIYKIKDRPMGVRVLTTRGNSELNLKVFGKIPVVKTF